MAKVKIRAIGNSTGVVLSRNILDKLRVDKGDDLYIVETQNGIELSPYNPEFDKQLLAAKQVMKQNRNLLRKLAK